MSTSSTVFAGSCPEIRLDESPELRSIPVWDQEDSLLCYAFSAAVLIDHARRKQAPGTESTTSPLALAAQTVNFSYGDGQRKRSSFWAGFLSQSIASARSEGVCEAGFLTDKMGSQPLARALPDLRALYATSKSIGIPAAAENTVAYLKKLGHARFRQEEIERLLGERLDLFLAKVIAGVCERNTAPLALPELQSEDRTLGTEAMGQRVESRLASGVPVAAEFCAEIVTNRKYAPAYGEICSRHYVVLVGQRMGKTGCEVLVRDSQCSQYVFSGGDGCNNGHYWIPKNLFLSQTHALHWLENPKLR